MGTEAISFSEQATAARRDYFARSNSGVVGQDVGDVVEKFTATPRWGPGVTSRSEVIVGVGGPPLHRPKFVRECQRAVASHTAP